jgi:hypothetical protein
MQVCFHRSAHWAAPRLTAHCSLLTGSHLGLPRTVSRVGRRCHPLERNSFCFDGTCQVSSVSETKHAKECGRRNLANSFHPLHNREFTHVGLLNDKTDSVGNNKWVAKIGMNNTYMVAYPRLGNFPNQRETRLSLCFKGVA